MLGFLSKSDSKVYEIGITKAYNRLTEPKVDSLTRSIL